MTLVIDDAFGQQEPEWEAVLASVRDPRDALALLALADAQDGKTLFANGLPLEALQINASLVTEWTLAELLAAQLQSLFDGTWTATQLLDMGYPEKAEIAQFVARCREAGVALTHRPTPPSPWHVVVAQVANDVDGACFAVAAAQCTANSIGLDRTIAKQLDLPPMPERTATSHELADFIGRCRKAGVVLRVEDR